MELMMDVKGSEPSQVLPARRLERHGRKKSVEAGCRHVDFGWAGR